MGASGGRWSRSWWLARSARIWKRRISVPAVRVTPAACSGTASDDREGAATKYSDNASDAGRSDMPPASAADWEEQHKGLMAQLHEFLSQHEQRILEHLDAHQQQVSASIASLHGGAGGLGFGGRSSSSGRSPLPREATSGRRGSIGSDTAPVRRPSAMSARSFSAVQSGPGSPTHPSCDERGEARRSSTSTTGAKCSSLPGIDTDLSSMQSDELMPKSPQLTDREAARRITKRQKTWNNQEQTALYRKKKQWDKIHQRLLPSHQEFAGKSFSKLALAIVCHPFFEMLFASLIVLNALEIGVQANWSLNNVGVATPVALKVMDHGFTIIFTIELLLRIFAEGRYFAKVKNRNFWWNLADAVMVASALVGDIVSFWSYSPDLSANLSVVRLVRVLRLVRAIRFIRVLRFFRDLRVMITGVAQSAKSLLWALLLLLLIIYVYAIVIMQVVSDHFETLHQQSAMTTNATARELTKLYGSLWVTVYTLFGSISGGHDWASIVEPLLEIHPLMGGLNMAYIGFSVLCVLNVITGVFVENAFKTSTDDDDKAVLDMLEARRQWIQEIKDLFTLADKSNTGYIDWEEFRVFISDVRVEAIFRRLGLDVEGDSAATLFQLVDYGGTGIISLDDFADGIQRVRGNARSIDICQLLFDSRALKRQVDDLARHFNRLASGEPDAVRTPTAGNNFIDCEV